MARRLSEFESREIVVGTVDPLLDDDCCRSAIEEGGDAIVVGTVDPLLDDDCCRSAIEEGGDAIVAAPAVSRA